jgi:hypothetical protein
MEYVFEMDGFMNSMMYYATVIFNNLILIGAIAAGLTLGIGLIGVVVKLVKSAISGGL